MSGSPIQRILVPVDLSSCSADALRFARALGPVLGASIDVLHVLEPSGTLAGSPAGGGEADPGAAKEQLSQFVASVEGPAAAISERVESGEVHERILAVSDQGSFDMIVMGTHGRTGRAHSLVGSVAESIVRLSPVPVLTVRESRAAQRSEVKTRN